MSDLISREFLQTAIHNFFKGLKHTPTEEDIQRYIEVAPPVEIKSEWIPITYRPMTEEEKEHYSIQVRCDKEDLDTMLDCQ